MAATLSPTRRSELRGEAHQLKPVVLIGGKGLTETVLAEIDRALTAHELVKVKAASDEREARDAWLAEICEKLSAHAVQQIGKVLVVYRQKPQESKPAPAPKAKPAAKRGKPKGPASHPPKDSFGRLKKPAEAITGTSRRRSRTPSPRPESAPPPRRPSTSRSGPSRSVKSRKSSGA